MEGSEIIFDSHAMWGCKPIDGFLLSLISCLGIDIVTLLNNKNIIFTELKLGINKTQSANSPNAIEENRIYIFIKGKNITSKLIKRLVSKAVQEHGALHNSLKGNINTEFNYNLVDLEKIKSQ